MGSYTDSPAEPITASLYSNGHYTTLNDPLASTAPGLGTFASGINNLGQIVGFYADNSGDLHGFLYSNGHYTTLNDPSAGTGSTQASDINDWGQIVGTYTDSNGAYHGFLAAHSVDLSHALFAQYAAAGFRTTAAGTDATVSYKPIQNSHEPLLAPAHF